GFSYPVGLTTPNPNELINPINTSNNTAKPKNLYNLSKVDEEIEFNNNDINSGNNNINNNINNDNVNVDNNNNNNDNNNNISNEDVYNNIAQLTERNDLIILLDQHCDIKPCSLLLDAMSRLSNSVPRIHRLELA